MEVSTLEGTQLLETVAALSGLSDEEAKAQLGQILEHSGQERSASDLTLDALRHAMLSYLEQMNTEFEAEIAAQAASPVSSDLE